MFNKLNVYVVSDHKFRSGFWLPEQSRKPFHHTIQNPLLKGQPPVVQKKLLLELGFGNFSLLEQRMEKGRVSHADLSGLVLGHSILHTFELIINIVYVFF